jgi:hypothetical protein
VVRIDPIAVWWSSPRQQLPCPILHEAPTAHPVGNQGALVFRHGPADLQQQPIVRIITHRAVEELNLNTALLQFLEQQHLVDIIASYSIRFGNQNYVKLS